VLYFSCGGALRRQLARFDDVFFAWRLSKAAAATKRRGRLAAWPGSLAASVGLAAGSSQSAGCTGSMRRMRQTRLARKKWQMARLGDSPAPSAAQSSNAIVQLDEER